MTNTSGHFEDSPNIPLLDVIHALNALYIISSAGAQLGGYGLAVSDTQRSALAKVTLQAKTVLDRMPIASETHAVAALRRLVTVCEGIVDHYSTYQRCPSAVWREAGRIGREAYEYIDQARTEIRCAGETRPRTQVCDG
jgi:hypothetical protein